jgi:hypothetical protein
MNAKETIKEYRAFMSQTGRPIPTLTVQEMSRVESMADTSEYEKIAEQMQIVRSTMSDASIAKIMKADTPEKLRVRDLFRDGGERLDAWLSVAFVVAMAEDSGNGTH